MDWGGGARFDVGETEQMCAWLLYRRLQEGRPGGEGGGEGGGGPSVHHHHPSKPPHHHTLMVSSADL